MWLNPAAPEFQLVPQARWPSKWGHTPAGTPSQPGEETIHLGEALFENSPVLAQDLRVGGAPLLQGQKQESVPAVAILHTTHLHTSHLPPVTGPCRFCRCLCQPSLVLCAGSSGAGTQDG